MQQSNREERKCNYLEYTQANSLCCTGCDLLLGPFFGVLKYIHERFPLHPMNIHVLNPIIYCHLGGSFFLLNSIIYVHLGGSSYPYTKSIQQRAFIGVSKALWSRTSTATVSSSLSMPLPFYSFPIFSRFHLRTLIGLSLFFWMELSRYVGTLYVKASSKPKDILRKLRALAGFYEYEEIELYEVCFCYFPN